MQVLKKHSIAKYLVFLLSLFVVFCFSCYRDVVDLDLEELEQQIVIEGSITDQPGPYRILISRSKAYYEPDVMAPITDAVVVISDNAGNAELLREGEAGVYWSRLLQGVPGRTYTLTVTVNDVDYVGVSTMPESIELDSIHSTYVTGDGWDYYELSCSFYDREAIEEFSCFKLYQDNQLITNYLYWDKFTDGEYIEINDFDYGFGYGARVHIDLLTIDHNVYNYWASLYEDINFDVELPDIIPLAPYNLEGNLSNGALGYFSAHTIRSYDVMIE